MEESKPTTEAKQVKVSPTAYDLFNDPAMKRARESLSKEDQEKYKKMGEYLFNNVNFANNEMDENFTPPIEDACAYNIQGLQSGLHPSFLEDNEKELLKTNYGDEWYTKWGYTEKDLTDF